MPHAIGDQRERVVIQPAGLVHPDEIRMRVLGETVRVGGQMTQRVSFISFRTPENRDEHVSAVVLALRHDGADVAAATELTNYLVSVLERVEIGGFRCFRLGHALRNSWAGALPPSSQCVNCAAVPN